MGCVFWRDVQVSNELIPSDACHINLVKNSGLDEESVCKENLLPADNETALNIKFYKPDAIICFGDSINFCKQHIVIASAGAIFLWAA
jgi:hypothetical protein